MTSRIKTKIIISFYKSIELINILRKKHRRMRRDETKNNVASILNLVLGLAKITDSHVQLSPL